MEETNIWLIAAAAGVFFAAVFVYVLFMVFLPEWVGISGKVAREAERGHREGAKVEDNDVTTRMQKNDPKT